MAMALVSLPMAARADLTELATKNGCMGCHKVDKKVFGPSFKEMAAKYKGDAAAPGKLLTSIKKGSDNAWGDKRKMPPQAAISEADAKQIIAQILAL